MFFITLPDLTQPYYVASIVAMLAGTLWGLPRVKWVRRKLDLLKSKSQISAERDLAVAEKSAAETYANLASKASEEAKKYVEILEGRMKAAEEDMSRSKDEIAKNIQQVEDRNQKAISKVASDLAVVQGEARGLRAQVADITSRFRQAVLSLRKYIDFAATLQELLSEFAPHGTPIPKPPVLPDDLKDDIKGVAGEA
jgi:Glu-tRNA(Gln) amidotransferase subunit E-like FAD-binding protein